VEKLFRNISELDELAAAAEIDSAENELTFSAVVHNRFLIFVVSVKVLSGVGSLKLRKGFVDTVKILVKTRVDTYSQECSMEIQDLRFSEWCCWNLKSSVIWYSVSGWIIWTFRTIVVPSLLGSKRLWPWRWINNDPSKCMELLTKL